jgi:DNA helicase IV
MLLEGIEGADGEALAQRAATDREWTYGHIVVDEAQELTAMDWRMLVRRCPSRSFTIVGDVAQTAALGGTRRWQRTMDAVFGAERWDLDELTINYRNPLEVSNRASDFAKREGLYISTLKAVRALPQSVNDITVERPSELETAVCEQVLELTRDFIAADGTGRIAIITPHSRIGSMRLAIRHHLGRHLDPPQFKKLDSQRSWDKQVMVCDTQMVKGLEYDAVIVVQPGEIESEAPSRIVAASDLYVAMTRPTQRLFVVRTRDDAQQLSV